MPDAQKLARYRQHLLDSGLSEEEADRIIAKMQQDMAELLGPEREKVVNGR